MAGRLASRRRRQTGAIPAAEAAAEGRPFAAGLALVVAAAEEVEEVDQACWQARRVEPTRVGYLCVGREEGGGGKWTTVRGAG